MSFKYSKSGALLPLLGVALICTYAHGQVTVPASDPPCVGKTCGGFQMSDTQLGEDVQLLERFVTIPSETNDLAGVALARDFYGAELQKLGFKSILIPNPVVDPATQKPIAADLLVAELAGKRAKFITIVLHVDTVFKAVNGKVPVPFQIVDSVPGPIQIEIPGKRILGSGVGDNKGGAVVALRALKMLLERGAPDYSLRVIVSTNEEVGSTGHQAAMAGYAADSVAVLGLEPSRHGHVLNGRGGLHWYEVTVTGVEGHAGIAHELGVNACLDLAIKATKISAFTDYPANTTVNLGTIVGGKRANIVCGSATAVVDTRFASAAADQALEAQLMPIFMKPEVASHADPSVQSSTTVKTVAHSPAFESNATSAPYFEQVLRQIKSLDGFTASARYSRGGADISFFKAPNAVLIDGLGPVTDGSHTTSEYIILDTLRTRALILADLMNSIQRKR